MGDDEVTQRHVKRLPPLRLEVGREEAVLRGVELRAAGGSTADWHTSLTSHGPPPVCQRLERGC